MRKYLILILAGFPAVLLAQSVSLTWKDNSEIEEGFHIERSLNGVNFERVATLPTPNLETWTDTDVTMNVRYWYRADAYNQNGKSAYSNTVNVMVPAPGSVPEAPADLGGIGQGLPPPAVLVKTLMESNEANLTSYNFVGQSDARRVSWTRIIPTGSYPIFSVAVPIGEAAGDTLIDPFVVFYTGDLNVPIAQVGSQSTIIPKTAFDSVVGWYEVSFDEWPPALLGQPLWMAVVGLGTVDSTNYLQHRRNAVAGRVGHSRWPFNGTITETSNGRSGGYRIYSMQPAP